MHGSAMNVSIFFIAVKMLATQSNNNPLGEKFRKIIFSLKFVQEPVNHSSVVKNLDYDAYKLEKSNYTCKWLFKTLSMVMFYLHCIHALQLRRIIVYKCCAHCQPAHDYQDTKLHLQQFFELSSA